MVREVNKKIIRFFKRRIGNIICLILCFNLVISLFVPITLVAASSLTNGVSIADPDTTDSYQNFLINEKNGSRYAGRVWSDKSVFTGNISLDKETDGYNGTITNNNDFLHVFSALGSSQRINGYTNSPIDAMFLLDMSGSMAIDIDYALDNTHTHSSGNSVQEHLEHSRMKRVLDSMNSAIDTLMSLNETNRVTVVAYGATAEVLMPLAHYEKSTASDVYLTVSNLTTYGCGTASDFNSGAYTVTAKAKKADDKNSYTEYTKSVSNHYPNDGYCSKNNSNNITYVGYHTDMQAGIYKGFNELYNSLNSTDDVVYKVKNNNDVEVQIPRIPLFFVVTDGGSNYALKSNNTTPLNGDEWHSLPDVTLSSNDTYTNSTFQKYRSEHNVDSIGGDAVILDILLTASYMKSKVQNKYTELLKEAKLLKDDEKFNLRVHTITVDTPTTEWQQPRIYATLNPIQYFNAIGEPSFNKTLNDKLEEFNKDITSAYKYFLEWQKGDITIGFCDSDGVNEDGTCKDGKNNRSIKFNRLNGSSDGVTNQDVIDNIYYNNSFHDISAAELEKTFESLISSVSGSLFVPVYGENEFGSNDSLTYMDPIGEYMEIKEDSIRLKDNKTYDMALLLFGNMYGIEKEAVYDYNFNQNHLNGGSFNSGWYSANGEKKTSGKWNNGDTYYLDEEEAKRYITDENARNDSKKKYIIYRLALDDVEREKMRKNKSYGDIDLVYYKLDDIKVLIEIDEKGNEKLYFNLPNDALPIEAVTIQMDKNNEKVESYKTNLADKELSTPLRLFYEVGLVDSIKTSDGKNIDLTKIDKNYSKKNTSKDNYLNFYSNYYSATTYDGYTADTQDGARTKGDALLTISPDSDNRYYIFQKNLKLYTKAYEVVNGQLKELTEGEAKNFEGHTYYGEFDSLEEARRNVSGTLKDGAVITLKNDVATYTNKAKYSSDSYYYIVADYYMPTNDGKGKQVQYIVSRKGSEFGSGLLDGNLPKGDFLCWYDESGKNLETYDYDKEVPKEKLNGGSNWVLATKIGGLRTGDLHQSISLKSENKTGTSKSYYLPIIADDLSTEGSDAILDTYLGNNGIIKYKLAIEIPNTVDIVTLFTIVFVFSVVVLIALLYRKKYFKKIKFQN